MKTNTMYYKIEKYLHNVLSNKVSSHWDKWFLPMLVLFLLAAIRGLFMVFDIWTFQPFDKVAIVTMIVIVLWFVGGVIRNDQPSERLIQKKAKELLEEFTSFDESACEDYSLFHEDYEFFIQIPIKSKEDLLQCISDLKEMLGYKDLADGGLHIAET